MRHSFLVLSLLLTIGGLPRSLAAAPPPATAKDVAAQVNARAITYQELNREFRARTRVPFESVQADPRAQRIRKQILDQIVNERLLEQEAERQKLSVASDAVEARVQALQARFPSPEAFNQELSRRGLTTAQLRKNIKRGLLRQEVINKEIFEKISVSPEELRAYFQKHRDTYVQEEKVHARHILIQVAPDASPEDDQKAKARATAVLAKARKGGDFAQLAKQHSEGPSGERGGDLGYFGRGKMVKPFEDAAFRLKAGQVSDLVRTQFGYHIIKVEEKVAAKRLSYAEAKDQVESDLTREKANAQFREFINALREKGKVTINLK